MLENISVLKFGGFMFVRESKFQLLIPVIALVALLSACASGETAGSDEVSEEPDETPTQLDSAPEESAVEEPIEDAAIPDSSIQDFLELTIGQTLEVTQDDGSTSDITIELPTPAQCESPSNGCDEPEIGDRVVSVPIGIENTGSTTVEWSQNFFTLEFPDGTQVEPGAGVTDQYTPDTALGFGAEIQPGEQVESVLIFEAPTGPYNVLILDSSRILESRRPIAGWLIQASTPDSDSGDTEQLAEEGEDPTSDSPVSRMEQAATTCGRVVAFDIENTGADMLRLSTDEDPPSLYVTPTSGDGILGQAAVIECLLEELGDSGSLVEKMKNTRMSDDVYEDELSDYRVIWSYGQGDPTGFRVQITPK